MTPTIIPVNSLQRHIAPLADELAKRARDVIASGYYVLGPGVAEFEREFAAYCGVDACIGVGNGTDALELCVRALDLAPDAQVAVVANAAMYGTSAVIAAGASPVFVDVDAETSNMSLRSLESALAANRRIQAVIVTHLYGRLAQVDEIVRICRARSVRVIEDCAQAHGARVGQGRAGSFGDLASFSFYPTKNLGALGDGGAVVTNDHGLADRVRRLRQYGWSSKYVNQIPGGRNTRLDEMQAQLLLAMLPHLDAWNARRREIANRYSSEIRNPRLRVPAAAGEDYVGHLYVLHCEEREGFRSHMADAGIQTDVHYPVPDYRQPSHSGAFDSLVLPVTEMLAATATTLPCFPELTDDEVGQVIAACNRY